MANEHLLKMIKNAFYFILKNLFVLRYLNLCPDFFGHVRKRLIRKLKLVLKFMTSQSS